MTILETLWQDGAYACRGMRNNPAFTLLTVLILAVGIGGTTSMFTVIRAVLLKPLAFQDPERLVQISNGATPARFEALQSTARSFTGIAAYSGEENLTITDGVEPEILNGVRLSAGALQILGVDPILGRAFSAAEDSPGGAPVIMIGAELWERRFHRDPAIIGKQIDLGAASYTVVAVLPAHFDFPVASVDVWLPRPSEWSLMDPRSRLLSPFLSIFGRLHPEVSIQQANAEMAVIDHQYASAHPAMMDARSKSHLVLEPMKERLVSSVRSTLYLLFGAVSVVLLIACANVASLLLARASGRSREFAVRSALGAARRRIIGQLLMESVLLSCAGGIMGMVLVAFSLRVIPRLTAIDLPRAGEIGLDWGVLGFTAALSLGTGLCFGLAPSLSASRPNLMSALRGHSVASSQNSRFVLGCIVPGLRSTVDLLVVGQIALSVILLIGAALLMQSVLRLRHVDVGFNPANLLTARISLAPARYDSAQKKAAFFENLVQKVRSSPGVRDAAAAMFLPMTGFVGSPVQDAGKPPLKLNERPIATLLIVTPNYFQTLGIPIRRGRDFAARDTAETQRVAIIDESAARRFWPAYPAGENPLGQHLLIGGVDPHPAEIIGIVPRVRQNLEDNAWPETAYTAFSQNPSQFAMLAIRTQGDPLRFTTVVRDAVRDLDRDQPLAKIRTMENLSDQDLGERQIILAFLEAFAGVALLLALTGVYAVISYSVHHRIHELGIRWALGAERADILWLVMTQGLTLSLAGLAIGIAGALALTRVIKSLLFGVSSSDPATFLAIALLFVISALLAAYIPARRAMRIDPMEALRV